MIRRFKAVLAAIVLALVSLVIVTKPAHAATNRVAILFPFDGNTWVSGEGPGQHHVIWNAWSMDLHAPVGTAVKARFASSDGPVTLSVVSVGNTCAAPNSAGQNVTVNVYVGGTFAGEVIYGHLDSVAVSAGASISPDTTLGYLNDWAWSSCWQDTTSDGVVHTHIEVEKGCYRSLPASTSYTEATTFGMVASSYQSGNVSVCNETEVGQVASGSGSYPNADDFVIFRPGSGTATWSVKAGPSGNSYVIGAYQIPHGGWSGDVPLVGDFNGDGKDDYVIYRPSTGAWSVKGGPSGSSYIVQEVLHGGWVGDIPLVGDIDGNGKDDFIIYRSSQGRWITKWGPDGAGFISDVTHGGWSGDVPLVGDIDGNGKDDFIIYRPASGEWITKAGPGGSTFISHIWHGGWSEDVPLVGDIDGSGSDDFVVYRPGSGEWISKAAPSGSSFISHIWHGGWSGDIPLIGDVDGNGPEDFIIYRPSWGRWVTKYGPGGQGYISDVPHGGWSGDIPLVGNFGS